MPVTLAQVTRAKLQIIPRSRSKGIFNNDQLFIISILFEQKCVSSWKVLLAYQSPLYIVSMICLVNSFFIDSIKVSSATREMSNYKFQVSEF